MELAEVMAELAGLANERVKKRYLSLGARQPLWGVATGAMKPLLRQIGHNQALAEQLYATGNYDAMYFAGVIADPAAMTEADFERWIAAAYFPMLAEGVVAVTLAEADCWRSVADHWIDSDQDLVASAGWSCYQWALEWRPDRHFDPAQIAERLERIVATIHDQPDHRRAVMNNVVIAMGVSYRPLHAQALAAAIAIGPVMVTDSRGRPTSLPSAEAAINNAVDKGRLGFKRRAVRC
jgi:hypothetical protein